MVVEKAYGDYTDFRIPGMVATSKGTLLRYCECRKASSDWADIDIKISRSEDRGASWETVLLINSDGNTLNNPVMFVDGDQLVFLHCKNYKEIWKRVSTDDGKSFSAAERIDFESSVDFVYSVAAIGPGHGILHNDTLVVPIWFAHNQENPKKHRPSFISTLYSEDHGVSWRVGEIIFPSDLKNPSECALAVTASNELLISIRHEGDIKKRGLAKSSTGFSEWRDLHFEDNLADPVCMGSMIYDGVKIYHSNCDSETERKNLTVKISEDCFKTYRSIAISDMGGYSDIALLDNKLYILYEKTIPTGNNTPPLEKPFELFFETLEI